MIQRLPRISLMTFRIPIILTIAVVLVLTAVIDAQTKRRTPSTTAKKARVAKVTPAPSPSPSEPQIVKTEPKKNERPDSAETDIKPAPLSDPAYFYEFAQPDFTISKIVIEHDEAGRGTISFTKKLFGDAVTDPIQISVDALERIKSAYAALNFVDSNESYQYEKNYPHLGSMTFRLKKGDKHRTAFFNYTVNKNAKVLVDEYRKLGNQFIWIFDIAVARENQPLEAPKLLDGLESLLRRNELSDPSQMLTLLKGMVDDERVPLIARNHAGKLAERIEKGKK